MSSVHTRLLCLVLVMMALAGCETMSREECLSADWYQVGYQAGREGKERSHVEDIAESCAKAKVTPDRQRYFSGRDRGLREYCTPEHGFYLGKNGTSISHVCPPESANLFEESYNQGYQIYDAREQVKRLENKRHRLEDQLEKANTDKGKKEIRDELEQLDKRLRSARDTLQSVESRAGHF